MAILDGNPMAKKKYAGLPLGSEMNLGYKPDQLSVDGLKEQHETGTELQK